ncbi:uncharacterized protein LOC131667736 [Phymastichus coffea]|uniref:uncharacterized protein LOC131667736 n=1 Tax=Phymastichus coffea TaxID=108790 RepID=UPI00273C0AAD|nr:uncharacterized protein LOC131667736 [Phymastichus coffea]
MTEMEFDQVKYLNLLNAHEFHNFGMKIAVSKRKTIVQFILHLKNLIGEICLTPLNPICFLDFRSATPEISKVIMDNFFPLSHHESNFENAITLYLTANMTLEYGRSVVLK